MVLVSSFLETIRIRVVSKDGIDDVELSAWADTTVGAFKERLGSFYKVQPGQIHLVLQVVLERYVLARMHRLKVRSTANSTIDERCNNFVSPVQAGSPRHLHVEGDLAWTGDANVLHASSMAEFAVDRTLRRCIRANTYRSNPIGKITVYHPL